MKQCAATLVLGAVRRFYDGVAIDIIYNPSLQKCVLKLLCLTESPPILEYSLSILRRQLEKEWPETTLPCSSFIEAATSTAPIVIQPFLRGNAALVFASASIVVCNKGLIISILLLQESWQKNN